MRFYVKKAFVVLITLTSLVYVLAASRKKESITYHHEPGSQQTNLVELTGKGQLRYGLYANEGETEKINMLPDFSYAGFKGGGVTLPNVPVKITLTPKPGDNKKQIQDAIDSVSSMPADTNGFRGRIILKAGIYSIADGLTMKDRGVVLAGEGQGEEGTVLLATKAVKHTFIQIGDASYNTQYTDNAKSRIVSDYVPTGSIRFTVRSAAGYRTGDAIIIQKTPNDQWVEKLGMQKYGWSPDSYMIPHERIITAIHNNHVTINIPIVDPIKQNEGGGQIYKVRNNRKTQYTGVENLRLVSVYKNNEDEEHGWCGIKLSNAENCWVKKVTVQYFGYSAVIIDKGSAFNTIEDCAMLDPKSKTIGKRKYSFHIQSGSFNLFQRCFSQGSRHDYVTGSRVTGPNVFLDSYAVAAASDIGPHMRWATGTLFDNIQGDNIRVKNRKSSGSGHGWAGAQTMLWNCVSTSGKGMTVESPPGGINWLVGGKAVKLTGNGFQELFGTEVLPRSLYLAQLENRLGQEAVHNVTTSKQRAGMIYADVAKLAGGK